MPASERTPHYDFPKYLTGDRISILGDFNNAFDTLDEKLYDAETGYDELAADVQTAKNSSNVALTTATEAKGTAQSAANIANDASANVATATAAASDAKNTALSAQTTANAANDTASNAMVEVTNAASSVANAVTTANNASSNANAASAAVQQFNERITDNTNDIVALNAAATADIESVWHGGPGNNVNIASNTAIAKVSEFSLVAPATGRAYFHAHYQWSSPANSAGRDRLVVIGPSGVIAETYPHATVPGRKVQNNASADDQISEHQSCWGLVTSGQTYTVEVHCSTDASATARTIHSFSGGMDVMPNP